MFGLFGKKPDFMTLLQEAKETKNAVVIDVREPDEYMQGHVPGSINIPTSQINTVNMKRYASVSVLPQWRQKQNGNGIFGAERLPECKNMGAIGQYRGELENKHEKSDSKQIPLKKTLFFFSLIS